MALAVNVSSSWKYVKQAYVNVNNSWKAVRHIYINSNGTWKPLYSYSWWTGDWSNCSVSCGGGTQTRSVVCVRNHPGQTGHVGDWSDVADTFCTSSGLVKPNVSQVCNTHSCQECRYNKNSDHWYYFRYSDTCWIIWSGTQLGNLFGDSGTTQYTYGGYRYTRGTQMDSSGSGDKYYQVCRQPV